MNSILGKSTLVEMRDYEGLFNYLFSLSLKQMYVDTSSAMNTDKSHDWCQSLLDCI